MKVKYSFQIICLLFGLIAFAQNPIPKVVSGLIERIENFKSQYVTSRNIDVWLPETYDGKKKFAVLYMHDGQMLFDPESTWNNQAWNIDDVATQLFQDPKILQFIVVAIWNDHTTRHEDYFPQKPFYSLTKVQLDTLNAQLQKAGRSDANFKPNSDNYLKFIVKELKPIIDRKYSVYTNKKNTFIMGSSMGGLISMYAICEYPEIFGGAACLSTHWIGTFSDENNPIPDAFLSYLNDHLPNPKCHKLYFDCGDQTLDAFYPAIQHKVDKILQSKGYTSKNWLTKYFTGADHSEKSWSERLDIPLRFLFEK